MKKLLSLLVMCVVALGLASCEDEYVAESLEGTWEGSIYKSSRWNGRDYKISETEIAFLRDPFRYTSGTGYWVDYYSGAPWDYVANHTRWSVDEGCITVRFVEEGTTLYIDDYRITGSRFEGVLVDGGERMRFSLRHTSGPDWGSMTWWDGDAWYDDWARTRASETAPRRVIQEN